MDYATEAPDPLDAPRALADVLARLRKLLDLHTRQNYLQSRDSARWLQLCAAMDAIGDTILALHAYRSSFQDLADVGTRYLLMYGAFQTLIVQQDAVHTVRRHLGFATSWTQDLRRIRDQRVLSVGHPTNEHSGAAGFITRPSVVQGQPRLLVVNGPRGQTTEDLDPSALFRIQDGALALLLDECVRMLEADDAAHRGKHRSTSLEQIIAPALEALRCFPPAEVTGDKKGDQSARLPDLAGAVRRAFDAFQDELDRRRELETRSDTLRGLVDEERVVTMLERAASQPTHGPLLAEVEAMLDALTRLGRWIDQQYALDTEATSE